MTIHRYLITGASLYCFANGLAVARDDTPSVADSALTTEQAPNTTVVGQTKPPSRDTSPTLAKAIERSMPRQAVDSEIAPKVCIGCKPDPAVTSSLPKQPAKGQPEHKFDTKLEELRTMAPPQQQSDLDTIQLASAHRERAKSMEEKTDGLWQSWLVSVCDGCGNQKPVRALRYEEWPDRNRPLATDATEKKFDREAQSIGSKPPTRHVRGSLEANLSPENVDSIRRMPQW